MGRLLKILFLGLVAPVYLGAYTNNDPIFVTDGSLADVQAAHNDAACGAGDTITIPSGTFTWTDTLSLTKAITLEGAGTSSTTIRDDVNQNGGWQDKCMIYMQVPATGTQRVTGIAFTDGPTTKSFTADGGLILVTDSFDMTTAGRGRIDNCTFTNLEQASGYVRVSGAFGLTDNCTFTTTSNNFAHIISHGNGDSWAQDTDLGTDKFWVIEDITYTKSGSTFEALDSDRGARWVVRYSTLTNSRIHFHGADSGTDQRGTRAWEIYENTISSDNSSTPLFNVRSGTGVIYNNTVTNYNGTDLVSLKVFRVTDDSAFSWGQADGTNGWDANNVGNPFDTGTSTSGGTLTMTDTGASWTTNEWVGYILKNTTTGLASVITGNTATTITFSADIGYTDPDLSFSAGNGYNINLVDKVLDMPGLGVGTMTASSGTPQATDSAVEPIYVWGNDVNGGTDNGNGIGATANLISGTHYFADTQHPTYTPLTYPHPLRGESVRRSPSRAARTGALPFLP